MVVAYLAPHHLALLVPLHQVVWESQHQAWEVLPHLFQALTGLQNRPLGAVLYRLLRPVHPAPLYRLLLAQCRRQSPQGR